MTRLLVDGNGAVCRLWWASPANVVGRFRAAVERVRPSGGAEVTVCWDHPGGSWRRLLYSRYKASRPPKPKALIKALQDCRSVFNDVEAPGFEADDIIGTLARSGDFALVLSDDKDLLQLVRGACLVVDSHGDVYDTGAVRVKLGVFPDQIRHLLSWMGDVADGLPGVRGYGPKRAIPRALAYEIGNRLTFELAELAQVPEDLMVRG